MALNVLTPPKPTNLGDSAIAGLLSTLFASPSLGQYAGWFYLHSFNINDFGTFAGLAEGTPDAPFAVDKFSQYNKTVVFNLQSISALQAVPPFLGKGEPFHVFVQLGNSLFPYQTASTLSACFLKGLVTRLLLEKYKENWSTLNINLNLVLTPAGGSLPPIQTSRPSAPPPPAPPAPPPPMTAEGWASTYLAGLSKSLLLPGTWTALKQGDYGLALSELTSASLQAAGMITGWIAGDALTSAAADYQTCDPVIWKWLNSRYTTRQLGMMMGYTFCYLSGFLECERTTAMIIGSKTPPAQLNGPTNIPTIFTNLTNSDYNRGEQGGFKTDSVFILANKFFELINGEFYGIAQQAGYANQATALANYQALINGFEQGLTQGADVMFAELFDAGYNLGYSYGYSIGYSTGFQAGYSQGYAAGYQEGYAVGYSAGQATWMGGLENIISGAGSLLGDASQIANILSDAATVGEVFASIF